MTGGRIVAILVGIAIAFALEFWLDASWFISLPSGAIGYFATRYVSWTINERRRLKRKIERVAERARRNDTD
jgi:hypothetical protein